MKQPKGQGLVEYALILVLVGLVATLAMGATGTSINELFAQVRNRFTSDSSTCQPLAGASNQWDPFGGKYSINGIVYQDEKYIACPRCGGIIPDYSGNDYSIHLMDVSLIKTNPTWNGYGVVFRAQEGANGINGYMFEVEK